MKTKKNAIILTILSVFIICAFWYAVHSFFFLSFNPVFWGAGGRYFYLSSILFSLFFYAASYRIK